LPRPNSGRFTFAEAETRKAEIYSLAPSSTLVGWNNPYSGFSVHITRDDRLVVYGGYLGEGEKSVAQIRELLNEYTKRMYGNPLGILITSESDPKRTKMLEVILEVLFKPYVQVFYNKSP
jgi:hypothetical protein